MIDSDLQVQMKFLQFYKSWEHGSRAESLDIEESLSIGKMLHINIVNIKTLNRYEVRYEFMGEGMHNYRCYFDGEPLNGFSWGTTEDAGWILCYGHHIKRLSELL